MQAVVRFLARPVFGDQLQVAHDPRADDPLDAVRDCPGSVAPLPITQFKALRQRDLAQAERPEVPLSRTGRANWSVNQGWLGECG
jgi:hypothetical protein